MMCIVDWKGGGVGNGLGSVMYIYSVGTDMTS
jgi:hypothetical protein